jgi:hypothetical protein
MVALAVAAPVSATLTLAAPLMVPLMVKVVGAGGVLLLLPQPAAEKTKPSIKESRVAKRMRSPRFAADVVDALDRGPPP